MHQSLRFLADEMLIRLGRWLRAAGYDVSILPPGTRDAHLVNVARSEKRLLITRDHKLLEFRSAASFVVCLKGNKLENCVAELGRKVPINWLHRTLSRCLICNAPLMKGDEDAWEQVPDESRYYTDNDMEKIWRCSGCNKVYWHGSHFARMRRQLAAWQRLNARPSQ